MTGTTGVTGISVITGITVITGNTGIAGIIGITGIDRNYCSFDRNSPQKGMWNLGLKE